jgi:predicted HNH restriction endonuclease
MSNPRRYHKDTICRSCGKRPVMSKGRVNGVAGGSMRYSDVCNSCHDKPWMKYRKDYCEYCGFIPLHISQLDIHHVDSNRLNNNPDNLQTLCANCHRLITEILRGELSHLKK